MIRQIIQRNFSRNIDSKIPNTVLVAFCLGKIFSLLRGLLKVHKKVFLERNVNFRQHKKIIWGKNCRCGRNATLDALSSEGIKFGNNCSIGKNTRIECTGSFAFLGKGFTCGNNCGLGTDCFYGCAGGIEIGDDVIVGNYVTMHSENHNYSDENIPIRLQGVNHKGIKIGNNCWIGAKATILDGTIIGDGCIVAAGAVVTGKFPDNSIIAGVPAKIIKSRL